jgi:DNA-binding CsgD family transcriptional regulator
MSRSNRLRLSDIEQVFALVHECRELWADARAWQFHLLRGACEITHTSVGTYNELRLASDLKAVNVLDEVDWGWRDAAARGVYLQMLADHPDRVRFLPRCIALAGAARYERCATALRPEMRPDREWRLSPMFNEYRRPAHLDGFAISFCLNPVTSSVVMVAAHQCITDPAPGARAKQTLSLLNQQIAPLVGTVLTSGAQRGMHDLSPRLRQTLQSLLGGNSEKQIAASLRISQATVHEYVGALYHHFGVSGRAELMAYFLRRRPGFCPASTVVTTQISPAPALSD